MRSVCCSQFDLSTTSSKMFGRKPDPKEQMKQQKRQLNRTQRDLTRDRNALDRQEKQLEAEIKKMAKLGNKQAATTLAKQLLQLRKQKTKNLTVQSRVAAVGYQAQAMHSNVKMAGAMSTASKTMGSMNAQIDPLAMQKTLQNFEKESMKMGMTEEMIDESLDSILDESGDEEEQEAIVNQVLDEIGIEVGAKMSEAPSAHGMKVPSKGKAESKGMSDAEIADMLSQLKA